jgi:cyclase
MSSCWPRQSIREVAEGIITITHGDGEVGVANANFILEEGRAFIVDTMTFPEMADTMAYEIARHNAHVEIVLNTHHHIDHIGGNKRFSEAHILAHPASIRALHVLGLPVRLYDRLIPQFKGRFDNLELVSPQPLQEKLSVPRGGEIHAFTPAHTATDLAVWFPPSRVLMSGDLCFIGVVPLAVNGLLSGWIEALKRLIALQPEIVIPGHGPVGTVTDLINLRNYFTNLVQLGKQAATNHLSLEDALSLFDPGPLADWREPERHEINLERAMQEAQGAISHQDLSAMPQSARKP